MSQTNEIKGVFYSISFCKCKQVYFAPIDPFIQPGRVILVIELNSFFFCFVLFFDVRGLTGFKMYLILRPPKTTVERASKGKMKSLVPLFC